MPLLTEQSFPRVQKQSSCTFGNAAARPETGVSQALFAAVTKSEGLRSQVKAVSSVMMPASVALSQKYEDT